jgi:lipopolysaccharide/colanic/teichoic acid biosynthesis glycosyltransferase
MHLAPSQLIDINKLSNRVPPQKLAKARAYDRHWSKRFLDLLISIPALIFLSPVFLITALAIMVDSPGAPFFTQERVGRYGKIFKMVKFRSMRTDMDDTLHQQHIQAYANGKLDLANGNKIVDDPRVTTMGRFIRRTSIDELPQLINVVLGDMSIVGPRPVPVYEADEYNLWQSERMNALPGITGLWQVTRRGVSSFEEQLRLDIRYIHNQDFWLNLRIILATPRAVISKAGAK